MKRILSLAAALALCMQAAGAADREPDLQGQEAVLYCAENGQVLLDKNMDTPAHPASITKLMTALVVLESGVDLRKTVTVSHEAVYSIERDSTHIALDEGEQVTLEAMLYAMLLTSANDAANVLAEAVDGTQEAFAAHMTRRAKELGCRHTHFVNAHGLDDRLHYTTAYDMARITCALLEYDTFLTVAGTQVYTMPATNKQSQARYFWNKQSILNPQSEFYDPSAIAGKNGYTRAAGHTLVTVARRDGVTLIAVTMGAGKTEKQRDTAALFDYGYHQFVRQEVRADTLARKAEAVGLRPDVDAVQPAMVLLPQSTSLDRIRYTREGDALLLDPGVGAPLRLEIPEQAVETVAPRPEAPPERGLGAVVWVGAGLGGALLLILPYLAHRTARIRRQRERLRRLWGNKP